MPKHRWSSRRFWEWFAKHAAVVVALGSLLLSGVTACYQVSNWRLQQENDQQARLHDRLSVRPILRFAVDLSFRAPRFREVGLHLINVGSGVALIGRYELVVRSASPDEARRLEALGARERPFEALARLLETDYSVPSIQRPLAIMDTLSPGESLCLLGLSPSAEPEHVQRLVTLIDRLEIRVPYSSLYGEEETVTFELESGLLESWLDSGSQSP